MRVYNRVLAFLFVMCLVINLALFPLRARAAGVGTLAAVAGVTVLGAYLMASGMYPYMTEAGQSLSEWTSDNLQPLLDKYNAYLTSIGKSYQITLQGASPTVKVYLTQGVVMIANDVWGKLSEFVAWLKSEYSLADNQNAVEAGVVTDIGLGVPSVPDYAIVGAYSDTRFYALSKASNAPSGCQAAVINNFVYVGAYGYVQALIYSYDLRDGVLSSPGSSYLSRKTYNGDTYCIAGPMLHIANLRECYLPVYATQDDFFAALGAGMGDFAGITLDTTTVAPLEALPDDVEWGGLAVEGTGAAASPAIVNDTIGGAIAEREKPVVRPVEVEVQAGTDVDVETGVVTEDVVTVTPEDVIPTVAALSPPASFLSALQTTMTTKFPFCLPFDLFKILQAFYVAPEAPVFYLSFHDPFSNSDFSITVDLSPWDEVAAVVRNFEAMILLAGFCLNFDRFNVIHLILGGLG